MNGGEGGSPAKNISFVLTCEHLELNRKYQDPDAYLALVNATKIKERHNICICDTCHELDVSRLKLIVYGSCLNWHHSNVCALLDRNLIQIGLR